MAKPKSQNIGIGIVQLGSFPARADQIAGANTTQYSTPSERESWSRLAMHPPACLKSKCGPVVVVKPAKEED